MPENEKPPAMRVDIYYIVRSIDILSKKEYTYLYENGKIVQSAESDITLDDNGFVVGKTFVCIVRYYYDAEDKLTKK